MAEISVVNRWKQVGVEVTEGIGKKLSVYSDELLKFNKKLNLISVATVPKCDAVHFSDAVKAWSLIKPHVPKGSTVFDFGSGNGIPGLVFAILESETDSDLKFRLVDRDERKLEFLKHVGSTVGLKSCAYLKTDVGDLPAGSVSIAVSRGFAPVSASLLVARQAVAVGGAFYMLKSEGWAREVASVPTQVFGSWDVGMLGQYKIPDLSSDFVVLKAARR